MKLDRLKGFRRVEMLKNDRKRGFWAHAEAGFEPLLVFTSQNYSRKRLELFLHCNPYSISYGLAGGGTNGKGGSLCPGGGVRFIKD